MTDYHYTYPFVIVDRATGQIQTNKTGTIVDMSGNGLVVKSMSGVPATLTTGPTGLPEPFITTARSCRAVVDGIHSLLISDEAMVAGDSADAAVVAAQAAQYAAEQMVSKASPVSHLGMGSDGIPFYSDDPILVGGGVLIKNVDGTISAVFAD